MCPHIAGIMKLKTALLFIDVQMALAHYDANGAERSCRQAEDNISSLLAIFRERALHGKEVGTAMTENDEQSSNREIVQKVVLVTNWLTEYYDYGEIELWWRSAHPQLNGKAPADVIGENGGVVQLRVILDRLDSNGYL